MSDRVPEVATERHSGGLVVPGRRDLSGYGDSGAGHEVAQRYQGDGVRS
ncbi:hypothetical protein [Nocardia sp. alder85J]|nr:hypothetical protein [Nocardia sp. alder85J]MCX4096207.1 hypothetical protein [Nocardia sp. alder85J]